MMHLRKSNKIFIYLVIFFFIGTLNNKSLTNLNYPKIDKIEIKGLSEKEKFQLSKDLFIFKNSNMFFLKEKEISEILSSNKIIEKFSIFKNYPSNLIIDIKKSKLLAYTKKNDLFFFITSNGNLVQTDKQKSDLPFIFGSIEIKEFLNLKNIIDKSSFNYDDIKNFYYFKSKRWDIETKDDIIIKLPNKKLENSFKILLKILEEDKFINLKIIDLRQNNQVILNG